jgi:hypothetical protein
MGLSLESMAIEMPTVAGHPNRVAFRGVLTLVDVASDRAPAGARGHRVILSRRAAEAAIPSLLGMGLDYSPRFDAHDTRRKIGVITRAEIVGHEIAVGGFLYGRDFPEIVEEIGRAAVSQQASATRKDGQGGAVASRTVASCRADISVRATRTLLAGRNVRATRAESAQTELGMSYEIADAVVHDIQAAVWVLNKVTFTGAAVLRRNKAAYQSTWIQLG